MICLTVNNFRPIMLWNSLVTSESFDGGRHVFQKLSNLTVQKMHQIILAITSFITLNEQIKL